MKTTNKVVLATAMLSATLALPTHAGSREDELLKELRTAYPSTSFSSVAATPIPGIFEVWMGPNVAYMSDKNRRHMIFGHMFDIAGMRDLTEPKLARRTTDGKSGRAPPIRLKDLPLGDALKTIRGNGERKLIIFSDPLCGYCRQLEPELQRLPNVTVFNFLLPFLGKELPVAIWCAADRQEAWRLAMADSTIASEKSPSCPHPIERNVALARRLNIHATPTLVFQDGERVAGFMTNSEIEARLGHAGITPRIKPNGAIKE